MDGDTRKSRLMLGRIGAGASRVATIVAGQVGLDSVLGVAVRADGLDRLPAGGMVVAVNHLSPVDPFLLAWLLEQAGHPDPVVLLREDLPTVPVVTRLLESGVLQVEDDTPDDAGVEEAAATSEAFGRARAMLEAGRPVLVSPERAASPSLELMPLRTGAAALAAATGAPLVPVGMFGTHRLFDGDRFRVRRNLPVTVAVGYPVDAAGPVRSTTKMLHLDMEALVERALDDYPDRAEGEEGAPWWPARRGGDAPTVGTVIDARANGQAVVGEIAGEPVQAEMWAPPEPADGPTPDATVEDVVPPVPVTALAHDEMLAKYPRSAHRNAAQQGGYLRDLKGVLAFDLPGQPHEHHSVVHLDHHVDGRLGIHHDRGTVRLDAVDLAASPVRVVVYGRVEVEHEVVTPAGPVTVPAGTLATFLGVPQDRDRPLPLQDWDHVRSIHTRA